jgi:hypothetical protein
MAIPVVFIHRGDQDYFKAVVKQTRSKNRTIVIGSNKVSDEYFIPIEDYNTEARKFEQIYEHLSTNPHTAELLCFTRWFTLLDFMKKEALPVCLYLDSDVLFFGDASQEFKKFDQFDFTLSHRCCGSNSFFTLKGLEGFCDFLMAFYQNRTSYDYERVAAHYHIRNKHGLGGGVCDMTLLEFYAYKICPGKVGEMMYIVDGSTYDHNINTSDQYYEMDPYKGIKNIQWIDGLPHCKQLSSDKLIRFNTLHFQGQAKQYITGYAR